MSVLEVCRRRKQGTKEAVFRVLNNKYHYSAGVGPRWEPIHRGPLSDEVDLSSVLVK